MAWLGRAMGTSCETPALSLVDEEETMHNHDVGMDVVPCVCQSSKGVFSRAWLSLCFTHPTTSRRTLRVTFEASSLSTAPADEHALGCI